MPGSSTNGLPVPLLPEDADGPGAFLALANAIDALYGATSTDFVSLPLTGDFPGQRVWLLDIENHAVWNGTAWYVPEQGGEDIVDITVAGTAATLTVDFPVPYPTGSDPTVTTTYRGGTGTGDTRRLWVTSNTNTTFTVAGLNTANTSDVEFNWHSHL